MPESIGHLNPSADGDVVFDRFELGAGLGELVRHVWVVRWTIAPGEVSEQRVLAYPAFNAVIEPGRAQLYGLDPRLDVRTLSGSSWVVGLLFRPAAASILSTTPPGELVGVSEQLPGAPLGALTAIMDGGSEPFVARRTIIEVLSRWLLPFAERLDDRGRLLNEVCRFAETDDSIARVHELANRAALSTRTLERLVRSGLGVGPKWLIECRRMQQAASRLHADSGTELAALAAELGFSDYAHFSRRYKAVIGETPRATSR